MKRFCEHRLSKQELQGWKNFKKIWNHELSNRQPTKNKNEKIEKMEKILDQKMEPTLEG